MLTRAPAFAPLLAPSLLALLLGATFANASPPAEPVAVGETTPTWLGAIEGLVVDASDAPVAGARVVVTCACLAEPIEQVTGADGRYRLDALPAGDYVLEVHVGDLIREERIELGTLPLVRTQVEVDTEAKTLEVWRVPVGEATSRDFTVVVELAPTASRDAAGISLAGTTGAGPETPRSGVLTAGTLDDNRSDELARFAAQADNCPELAQQLGRGPRAELLVVDRRGVPVQDAELWVGADPGQGEWRLRTGTDGRAVVDAAWDLTRTPKLGKTLYLGARKGKAETTAQADLSRDREDQGPIRIVLPMTQTKAAARVRALDLVLVVDATGSMADELQWLTAELGDVVDEVLAEHPGVDARLGIVAYRDHGDAYVTRPLELTRDRAEFQRFLAAQRADGGGDWPEAVDEALLAAARLDWRHDAQAAKVVLWVGDAPPHDERVAQTFAATGLLRAAGVSVYPIASSGVADEAELIYRVIAADTAAQYLFLTDDSGIGLAHAEPHADDYGVELLADALVRVLEAELNGEQAALPTDRPRPARAGFGLERSLLDDGGRRELLGGPRVVVDLF